MKKLDATSFGFTRQIYKNELVDILEKITICYKKLRADNKKVPLNDENGIRDILVNDYINNPNLKKEIELKYFVLPEVPEKNTAGRTDIRIFRPNSFLNQDEYYIIECKRLDDKARSGTSGLNAEYIRNGIKRFTTKYYSSYDNINAMIGFIVEKLNIDDNVNDINNLIKNKFSEIKTPMLLTQKHSIMGFSYFYYSEHVRKDSTHLTLYHLMFDLT